MSAGRSFLLYFTKLWHYKALIFLPFRILQVRIGCINRGSTAQNTEMKNMRAEKEGSIRLRMPKSKICVQKKSDSTAQNVKIQNMGVYKGRILRLRTSKCKIEG